MAKTPVRTDQAPAAIGPYSQAVLSGGVLYCSGQIGLDPASGNLVAGGFEAEARQVLANLDAVARGAGMTLADAVKLTVYVTSLAEFPKLNDIFASVLAEPYPARATVEVSALPKGALVEVDMVASRGR
jgi:2-iminobutanoate/2-iminopropanoate deaminase